MAVTTPSTLLITGTGDFVTGTLNGAITSTQTTATIDTGLNIPATSGVLQISYDSTSVVGATDSPETVTYATYTTGTGALTGLSRGVDPYTVGVAHSDGQRIQAGLSTVHLNNLTDIIENIAWQPWTITWTNLTIGNGTAAASAGVYMQLAKRVEGHVQFLWGNTTSASGEITFSLPVTPKTAAPGYQNGSAILSRCSFYDSSATTFYPGYLTITSGTKASLHVTNTAGTYGVDTATSDTIPFTWATNDVIYCTFSYETA